jgi:hypothetical protein
MARPKAVDEQGRGSIRLVTTWCYELAVVDAALPDREAIHQAEDQATRDAAGAASAAGHIVLDEPPRLAWRQMGDPDPTSGLRPVRSLTSPHSVVTGTGRRPASGWWSLVVLLRVAAAPGTVPA